MSASPASPAEPACKADDFHVLGKDGAPIRILSFSGGGFSTALQLGVAHALLVARRQAPDMVIGSSAGAINAVAVAEIYQAGEGLEGDARWAARVARVRRIFQAYVDAPGSVLQNYTPDHFQIEIEQPLQPQELPLHSKAEKDHREEAVKSRSGLMNLYNTLIDTRIPIGDITLGLRRILGIRQAAELRPRWKRIAAIASEAFQLWNLLGRNLWRLAPLVRHAVGAAFKRHPRSAQGTTAAGIIFRSRAWRFLLGWALRACSFLMLGAVWTAGSLVAAILPFVLGLPVAIPLTSAAPGIPFIPASLLAGAIISSPIAGLLAPESRVRNFWRSLRSSTGFLAMLAAWAAGWHAPEAIVSCVTQGPLDLQRIRAAIEAFPSFWGVLALGLLNLLAAIVVARAIARPESYARLLLKRFHLNASLLDPHSIREILIALFDPTYYGKPVMPRVVERALDRTLNHSNEHVTAAAAPKTFGHYSRKDADPPIHVAATAAEVASGRIVVLDRTVPVVDGLLASVAVSPLFPPVQLRCEGEDRLFIDGANVSAEPTRPLFAHLRRGAPVNGNARAVHVFSVSSLPFSKEQLEAEREGGEPKAYEGLIEIALRARELERFRDSTMERRLTELQTRAMPQNGKVWFDVESRNSKGQETTKRLFRSWVFPIEPERSLRVNERVMSEASPEGRRKIVSEAVAEGCRATLQAIVSGPLERAKSAKTKQKPDGAIVPCWEVMKAALRRADPSLLPSGDAPSAASDPGGPGLPEVCSHCVVIRMKRGAVGQPSEEIRHPQSLVINRPHARQPRPGLWPEEGAKEARWQEPVAWRKPKPAVRLPAGAATWPLQRGNGSADPVRPTVSFLFSGGVFRGVFQVGVISGLSEAGVRPDVVAGASVGSIMAAMAASAFAAGEAGADALQVRRTRVLQVASAFLAIDRLVLTDQFSDFIRGLTVRASGTRFSWRQFDRVFRRIDAGKLTAFGRDFRTVLAGLERLTYITPLEQLTILEALKKQQYARALTLLRKDFQNWLDRAGVGIEVLGAAPLELLIGEFVLAGLGGRPDQTPLGAVTKEGIALLATATNLTAGCLEILGEDQLENPHQSPVLLQTLLASSAFPGVFRPRRSEEVLPTTRRQDQFIDGGVTDNLPLDAVAQFLHRAASRQLIQSRPEQPHLVIAASLQEEPGQLVGKDPLKDMGESWPLLFKRATRLGYNEKLRVYERTQRNIQDIIRTRSLRKDAGPPLDTSREWTPLNLEVLPIIPTWLCGTFAFHPMLGFRQSRQAESIAHGCRTTLFALRDRVAQDPAAASAWGIDASLLPPADAAAPVSDSARTAAESQGHCWYRPGVECPFSKQGQRRSSFAACDDATREAVGMIYARCGDEATHRAHA